jgi:hypothetical protein
MSTFTLSNVAVTIATLMLLLVSVLRQRHLVLKPSLWVVAFFHIQIQWAASFNSSIIEQEMTFPWHFFCLTQLVPFVTLCLSLLTFKRSALAVWSRFSLPSVKTPVLSAAEGIFLVGLWATVVVLYFTEVRFTQSGLWVLLTSKDYLLSVMAREDSLKLIGNPLVKYAYAYNANFLALFLGFFVLTAAMRYIKKGSILVFGGLLIFYSALIASTALSGARSPAAVVLMGTLIAFWLRAGAPMQPMRLAIGALLVLCIPTVFTMLRSPDLSWDAFVREFQGTIVQRAFFVPMYTGEVFVRYAQENGYWGVSGMPKLAELLGEEPINVPNYLANMMFTNEYVKSGLLSTSFVFSWYSNFGLGIVPLLVILLLGIDVVVLAYSRFADSYLVPGLAAINTGCLCLTSTEFTTLFLTYGYLTGLVTVFGLMFVFKGSLVQQGRNCAVPENADKADLLPKE